MDGLRAVAVGLVVAFHFLERYFPGGAVGVDVFFVISGFVITRSLLADKHSLGHISLSRFYRKRVFRIMPALWLTVAVTLLAGFLLGQPQEPQALATLLSAMNWARAFDWVPMVGGALAHAWSLSIEEQFYLLWPVALVVLLKRSRGTALAILAAVVLAIIAWRGMLMLSGSDFMRVYNGLDTHADGLMIGCLIAFWARQPPRWLSAAWIVPVAALGVLTLFFGTAEPGDLGTSLTLRTVICGWLVWIAAGPRTALHPLLASPLFQWGGSRSYSLYLWHYPFAYFLHHWDFWFPAKLAIMAGGTVLCAELCYRLVEQPFLRGGRMAAPGRATRSDARDAGPSGGTTPAPAPEPDSRS